MISKEQIAHDLTIIYLENKYGVQVKGNVHIHDGSGDGTFLTEHFPSVSEPAYIKVKTEEKGLFGINKTEKVRAGNKVDPLFVEMIQNYYQAYTLFYGFLCKIDTGESAEE